MTKVPVLTRMREFVGHHATSHGGELFFLVEGEGDVIAMVRANFHTRFDTEELSEGE